MRKIEKEMLQAIKTYQNFSKSNTIVDHSMVNNLPTHVYLHGNHIASVYVSDEIKVFPNLKTLEEYPTPTTKSRLRALGVNVYQSKGKIYIDENYICNV